MQSRDVTNAVRQKYYRLGKVFCIVDHTNESLLLLLLPGERKIMKNFVNVSFIVQYDICMSKMPRLANSVKIDDC